MTGRADPVQISLETRAYSWSVLGYTDEQSAEKMFGDSTAENVARVRELIVEGRRKSQQAH